MGPFMSQGYYNIYNNKMILLSRADATIPSAPHRILTPVFDLHDDPNGERTPS